eukprot:CAMPEP_0202924836 /NCGR_PEP_ID=MMETSP1392-20130828/79187_1 /ASSEMBLY_ACC=CAM_ASM_000868 /TAXON_ID=225041 /ORGANISM="Chlamydomonas chlamydogama, Strain SAG 11-48b" /LENGTH=52 /DNA_ID=CAMNT_0049618591 /DNA_START=926 /DNA_END=1081 /DNA_ORIENTATION=+
MPKSKQQKGSHAHVPALLSCNELQECWIQLPMLLLKQAMAFVTEDGDSIKRI